MNQRPQMFRRRGGHEGGRGIDFSRLLAILVIVGFSVSTSGPLVPPAFLDPPEAAVPPSAGSPVPAPLALVSEVYGDSTGLIDRRLRDGMASGASLHPPLGPAEREVARKSNWLVYFAVPSEAGVEPCYPASVDDDAGRTLADLGVTPDSAAWRLGMPEFDQGGGCWARGRPSPSGLTDAQVYDAWTRYYLDTKGLRPYLEMGAQQRGHRWMAVCVYAFCPQYAYDLGADFVLLERNIDEVSGMSPGLAMVRGASVQNGGAGWGIDISTYRYWNGGPTTFGPGGTLLSGWSPSTFERNYYAAYMAGAGMILNEAADYNTGATRDGLNPLGLVVRDFADFSLRRNPDRGTPYVPMALLQDHRSGYEPRFGEYEQAPRKWYRQNPYTPGDVMLDGVLELAYPGHRTWGTIVADAPWKVLGANGAVDVPKSQAAYRQALAGGGVDPRRWEPMGSTRWGETLDVITDRATLDTLARYKVVVMVNSGPIGPALLATLDQYVRGGGSVVLNTAQLPPGAEELTGVRLTAERRNADAVTWRADATTTAESSFTYTAAIADGAEVVAATAAGDPVITRHGLGEGSVYVSTADHLFDGGGRGAMAAGRRLLDELQAGVAAVTVEGPPVQYLVNTRGSTTIITVINTDVAGSAWNGTLSLPAGVNGATVTEWTQDLPVASALQDGRVSVAATVPPYGVRVYAVEPAG